MSTKRLLTAGIWLGAAALVVLTGRSIAYALAPSNRLLLDPLRHSAGGPRLVLVALVLLGVAVALAAAVVWLAALGVRERAALAAQREEVPLLRPLRVGGHALALTIVTCGAFSALESYLHLRAGLPWHGLGCLTGPVHVGALPILAGLSVLAAAALDAAAYVLRWMRRTLRLLLAQAPRTARQALLLRPLLGLAVAREARLAAARPRPPPLVAG